MTDICLRYRDTSVPGATGYGRQTECPAGPVRLRGVEIRDDFVYINYEPVKSDETPSMRLGRLSIEANARNNGPRPDAAKDDLPKGQA